MNKEKLLRNKNKGTDQKGSSKKIQWKMLFVIIPILVLTFLFTWFYQAKNIVMSVGPLPITTEELEIEKQRLTPPDYAQKLKNMDEEDRITTEERVRAKALENLMKLKCVYLYAQENEITVSNDEINAKIEDYAKTFSSNPDESIDIRTTLSDYGIPWRSFWHDMKYQAIYDKVLEPIRKGVEATEQEMRAHYNEFAPYYDIPARVQLHFIVVEEEGVAKEIMDQLLDGAEFEKIAQEKSISPTVMSDKGDMGWVTKDELYTEIANNVFLPEFLLEEYYLLQARDGWYILRVDERTEEKKNTFEEVLDLIEEDVIYQKQDQAVNGFMNRLSDQYEFRMVVGNRWTKFLDWWDRLRGVIE
ncbi:MAG: peptidyl-prolyl cis-trans isomerase [Caldisericia bacterium]|nr:peptidyl-prolyl cis-trans isomerase [Caldisericia bacterium]MDD4614691.1 peptidyl-prolyl cis-trans isomerase [Caldisericia bacterium]